MKTIKISDLHYEMAKEKMKSTKAKRIEEYIEMLVQQVCKKVNRLNLLAILLALSIA